jgi:MFS family permease
MPEPTRKEIEPEIMCSTSLDDIYVGHAREKLNLYNYMVVVAVSCGALAVGMVNGMISTTLGQPSFLEYFGFMQFTATKRPLTGNTPLIGAILGVHFAAALFGAAFGAYASDKFGRKKALMIGAIIATCSSGLVAGSVHIAMLLVLRYVHSRNTIVRNFS